MKRKRRVAIIILNHNTSLQAIKCARSFYEKCCGDFDHLLIVDSASRKAERELLLKERPPGSELLLLKKNAGYTGGNNAGVYYLMTKYFPDYFLLVNADTYVENGDFLKELVQFMEEHPDAGFTGPLVFLRKTDVIQNTVLQFPFLKRLMWNWILFRLIPSLIPHSSKFRKGEKVEFLNGVCIMIRKEVFDRVGFFREDIFMYGEDADLQWRARLKGFYSYFVPVPSVVHEQKEWGYSTFSQVSRWLRINTLRFLLNYSWRADAFIYAFLTLLLMGIRAVFTGERDNFTFLSTLFRDFRGLLFSRKMTGK